MRIVFVLGLALAVLAWLVWINVLHMRETARLSKEEKARRREAERDDMRIW